MGLTEDMADEIAQLALADELRTGDDGIIQAVAEILGASSQTLSEAYLTSIRVRRAEKRARELLMGRLPPEPEQSTSEPDSERSTSRAERLTSRKKQQASKPKQLAPNSDWITSKPDK